MHPHRHAVILACFLSHDLFSTCALPNWFRLGGRPGPFSQLTEN
uniref:Uncharacterized protein n=1 Tax=Zea mays TaxID=4577 RepID=C0P2S6_MAIZE|nr:unknown [Zea mays]